MPPTMNLRSHYDNFFYVSKANSQELLDQAFKLRYEVYVKDCGYKFHNPYAFQEIEKDSYDEESHHCLLFHKPTKKPIGYIRLIPYKPYDDYRLPIESFGISFNQDIVKKLRSPGLGEISRMSIHPSFRRRLSDKLYLFEDSCGAENSRFRVNYLPVCLVLACAALMHENNIEYSVALMEYKLAVLVKKYGVTYQKIGSSIKLNGIRTPYMMANKKVIHDLTIEFKDLFKIIRQELNSSQAAH